jgi:hypothetical protein
MPDNVGQTGFHPGCIYRSLDPAATVGLTASGRVGRGAASIRFDATVELAFDAAADDEGMTPIVCFVVHASGDEGVTITMPIDDYVLARLRSDRDDRFMVEVEGLRVEFHPPTVVPELFGASA